MPAIPAQSFGKLVDEKCHSDVYRTWSAQNVDQKIAASASVCDLSVGNWPEEIAGIAGRTRDRLVRETGGELIAERPIVVDEVEGLAVDIRRGEKHSFVRLFEKHGVFYLFEVSGVGLELESPAVTRYWKSLELTPENVEMFWARKKQEDQNAPANPNETDSERIHREARERHAAAVAEAERRRQESRAELEKKLSRDPKWRETQERIRQTKERLAEEARLRDEERAREWERRQAEFEKNKRPSTSLPIPSPFPASPPSGP